MYGIVGLLLLVLDVYVIYMIIIGRGEPVMKLVWVIVVLLLPLLGPILYLLLGRGSSTV
jgi:Phospholipase_D-nuclease N-terminal